MITMGIDVGASSTKAVIMDGDKILAKYCHMADSEEEQDEDQVIKNALSGALAKAGISRGAIGKIVATGGGGKKVGFADEVVTEISSGAKGAIFEVPASRTVVDMGAEKAAVAKCDTEGNVVDFATNERCAAGAGAFIEAMSRALQTDLETFVKLYFESDKNIPLNAQCAVFAESEVVSLINTEGITTAGMMPFRLTGGNEEISLDLANEYLFGGGTCSFSRTILELQLRGDYGFIDCIAAATPLRRSHPFGGSGQSLSQYPYSASS
ncbi:acyl-CoA dehydratase activase [Desulfobacterium sp. N47]